MNSLQEFLDEKEQTEQPGFVIDDDSKANWALRKIKQYQEQQEQNNALAQEEIDKIEAWNQQANDEAQQSSDYFRGLLSAYALQKRENDPKFKSQKLPNGRIRFKKQQPKWRYDDSMVVQALKNAGLTDYIRTKEIPSKSDIKKHFNVSGGKVISPDGE